MSESLSAEVIVEEPVSQADTEMRARIRAQVNLSSAVRDYLDAVDKFDSASNSLRESSKVLREQIKPNMTVVIRPTYGDRYGKHYLLKTDEICNFDVDPIEVI